MLCKLQKFCNDKWNKRVIMYNENEKTCEEVVMAHLKHTFFYVYLERAWKTVKYFSSGQVSWRCPVWILGGISAICLRMASTMNYCLAS